MANETKVCACCGKTYPITEFKKIGRRGGGYSVLTICQTCMKARQKAGKEKKRQERQEVEEKKFIEAKNLRLIDFTPRELMQELAKRGYKGKLVFTQVREIDIESV